MPCSSGQRGRRSAVPRGETKSDRNKARTLSEGGRLYWKIVEKGEINGESVDKADGKDENEKKNEGEGTRLVNGLAHDRKNQ
jgi:hypothetical protein